MTVHLLPGIGGTPDLFRDSHFPFPVRHLGFIRPTSARTSFEDYSKAFAHQPLINRLLTEHLSPLVNKTASPYFTQE